MDDGHNPDTQGLTILFAALIADNSTTHSALNAINVKLDSLTRILRANKLLVKGLSHQPHPLPPPAANPRPS